MKITYWLTVGWLSGFPTLGSWPRSRDTQEIYVNHNLLQNWPFTFSVRLLTAICPETSFFSRVSKYACARRFYDICHVRPDTDAVLAIIVCCPNKLSGDGTRGGFCPGRTIKKSSLSGHNASIVAYENYRLSQSGEPSPVAFVSCTRPFRIRWSASLEKCRFVNETIVLLVQARHWYFSSCLLSRDDDVIM